MAPKTQECANRPIQAPFTLMMVTGHPPSRRVSADAVEFRPVRSTGKVLGRERVAIAEIATVARMAED